MSSHPAISNDNELDQASERLDALRRAIAKRVIACAREATAPETDGELAALRGKAEALLTEISRFEFLGAEPE